MQIHELPDVTAIGSGGYFATDNGSQTTKIDYDALAKAIIEQYSGSTLAGAAQSVKAALDGIKTDLNVVYGANSIKTLAATDDLLTLDVGMYRVANVLPLNAPSTTYKYGYATKQHRGASGYTYYEFIVGNGNGNDFKRYYGWQYSNSATSIDWIEMAPQSAVDALNSNLQRVIPPQTSERGKTYAEHIQLQLDANNLPIGTPFFCAIDYYEKGKKPTAGFIYLASNQKYGSIAIFQDNVIIVVNVVADVTSQKTVSLS